MTRKAPLDRSIFPSVLVPRQALRMILIRLLSRLPAVLMATGLSLFAHVAAAQEQGCYVDDPTGTPLNVRSTPNGTILTTLSNGTRIDVVDDMVVGTKRWLFVARQGERLGWIFGGYVVCPEGSEARGTAPSEPADRR